MESILLLFVVFDSIGNAPLFLALTKDFEPAKRRRIMNQSIAVACLLLVFFTIAGEHLLIVLGVTLDDFRIAGGILLLILAIEGLLGREEAHFIRSEQIAIVPLATPLLAGPGSICTVLYLASAYGYLPTLISIFVNAMIAWLIFRYVEFLVKVLGHNFIVALSRIMAFILAVLSISMIRRGLAGLLRSL